MIVGFSGTSSDSVALGLEGTAVGTEDPSDIVETSAGARAEVSGLCGAEELGDGICGGDEMDLISTKALIQEWRYIGGG